MRPLELTIQGFKSYRGKCSFHFEGRGLFGIVGPTGAGKSSILDALIYCLYGKTPRLERETRKLINSEEDEAKLQLSFEMDGVAWQVTRVIRRKGQSQVLLKRLDEAGEPVTGDRNVNEKLPPILGLDFGAFCASVCLSQGEFDRFLRATASERVQILKGVFALDKVDALREAAKRRSRDLNDQMRLLEGTLDALPADIEAGLEASEKALVAAAGLVEEIKAALPGVNAAQEQLQRSAHEEELLSREREAIQQTLASIPGDRLVRDLVDREERAAAAAAEAEDALSGAEAAFAQAEEQLAAIEAGGKGRGWCSVLQRLIQDRAALRDDKRMKSEASGLAEAALLHAQTVLEEAGRSHKEAERSLRESRAELSRLEQSHAAHYLRAELRPGEPCPVCTQTVSEIPPAQRVPALDAAKSAWEQADARLTAFRRTLESSGRALALAEERRRSAQANAAQVAERMAQNEAEIRKLVGSDADPEAELEKAKQALEALRQKAQAAASNRQRLSGALRQASASRNEIAAETLKMVTLLSGICGRFGHDPGSIAEEGLPQTVKRLREHAGLRLSELDQQAEKLSESLKQARSTVMEFRSRFGAEADATPAEVLAGAISDMQAHQGRIKELKAALTRRNEAQRRLEALRTGKALYDRLSTDLTDSKFTAYLLTEQTRLLCELASEKFRELSGYYTFDFDAQGNITVVDERTGAVRNPQDTLSGGESFLASLSLALALAETVANRGGRLECFFLDEGFGSLDAEALDRALDGIQTLAEPGRMIGLISHVGGIQSQLDDLIVLERNSDGSTSVVQESGPIAYLPAAI